MKTTSIQNTNNSLTNNLSNCQRKHEFIKRILCGANESRLSVSFVIINEFYVHPTFYNMATRDVKLENET